MTEPRIYKFGQCSGNNELIHPHSTHATFMNTPTLQKKRLLYKDKVYCLICYRSTTDQVRNLGSANFYFLYPGGTQQLSAMFQVPLPMIILCDL